MLQANMTTLRQEEKDLLLDSDCVPGGDHERTCAFLSHFQLFPAIYSPRLKVILDLVVGPKDLTLECLSLIFLLT